jgi:hypothetical protein
MHATVQPNDRLAMLTQLHATTGHVSVANVQGWEAGAYLMKCVARQSCHPVPQCSCAAPAGCQQDAWLLLCWGTK